VKNLWNANKLNDPTLQFYIKTKKHQGKKLGSKISQTSCSRNPFAPIL
jgi:hypothetical protein